MGRKKMKLKHVLTLGHSELMKRDFHGHMNDKMIRLIDPSATQLISPAYLRRREAEVGNECRCSSSGHQVPKLN